MERAGKRERKEDEVLGIDHVLFFDGLTLITLYLVTFNLTETHFFFYTIIRKKKSINRKN